MVSSISRSIPSSAPPRLPPPHYQTFLTPILHRRFARACLVGFAACYLEAFVISNKSSCLSPPLLLSRCSSQRLTIVFDGSFLGDFSIRMDRIQGDHNLLPIRISHTHSSHLAASWYDSQLFLGRFDDSFGMAVLTSGNSGRKNTCNCVSCNEDIHWIFLDLFNSPYTFVCFSGVCLSLFVVQFEGRSPWLHHRGKVCNQKNSTLLLPFANLPSRSYERPRLNERFLYLVFFACYTGFIQAALHLYEDRGRLQLPHLYVWPNEVERTSILDAKSSQLSPKAAFKKKFPEVPSGALHMALVSSCTAPFAYMPFRGVIWHYTLATAKTFYW